MTKISEVTPADFEPDMVGRPWLSRQLARARAAWPRGPLCLQLPTLGDLRLSISGIAPIEHQATAGVGQCESYALWRGGRLGRLDVDSRFAVATASALFGTSGPIPVARMLSPGERGALAAVVGLVLDATAAPISIVLDAPDAVPLRLDLQVELDLLLLPPKSTGENAPRSQVVGWARLFLPWSWFESGGTLWSNLARVSFPVSLQVARTSLDRNSLAALQVGDALVFDGYEDLTTSNTFGARLVVGAFFSPAQVASGDVRLQGQFAPMLGVVEPAGTIAIASTPATWKSAVSMSSTIEMAAMPIATGSDAPSASLSQALVNTPVEVVAEVGRFVLTGAELAGLEQGEVFSLGTSSKGSITLSIAGRPVARGALVNIDGTFGVRVTERY